MHALVARVMNAEQYNISFRRGLVSEKLCECLDLVEKITIVTLE
jgi:hypothetical protein